MMNESATTSFTYVSFIRTTPDRLWSALVEKDFMKQYWFNMHIETDWKQGSSWKLLFADGRVADGGEVVEIDPPKRLVLTWKNEWNPEFKEEGYARLTLDLEPLADAVKLTVTHTMERAQSPLIQAVSGGWPSIISNLKSLLETGEVVLKDYSTATVT